MSKTPRKNLTKEIAEELDTFDEMFDVLLELLDNKGILNRNEFEAQLKSRIEKRATKKSYREIQFQK